jgi:hypothetical protein
MSTEDRLLTCTLATNILWVSERHTEHRIKAYTFGGTTVVSGRVDRDMHQIVRILAARDSGSEQGRRQINGNDAPFEENFRAWYCGTVIWSDLQQTL